MKADTESHGKSELMNDRTVGILAPVEKSSEFWTRIINAIITAIQERGGDVRMIGYPDELSEAGRIFRLYAEGRIDSIIDFPRLFPALAEVLPDLGIPVVHVLGTKEGFTPHIGIDHSTGLRDGLKHLKDLGHTDVLWTGMPDLLFAPERFCEFDRHTREMGFSVLLHNFTIEEENSYSIISRASQEIGKFLRTCRCYPTAVVGYNDLAALGAVMAIEECGLSIPGDVSVIGYDDMYALYSLPPLSTVSLNFREIGIRAAETALIITDGDNRDWVGQNIQTGFVQRESTGPVSGARKNIHTMYTGNLRLSSAPVIQ
jgi:LacI family transcriptional regulator